MRWEARSSATRRPWPVSTPSLGRAYRQKIEEGIEEQRQRGAGVVVLDAAVLIEAGWTDAADEVWVVTAPEEDVIRRIQARNNLTEEQIRARMASQMPSEERVEHADVVVVNDGEIQELQRKIGELWEARLAGDGLAGRSNG